MNMCRAGRPKQIGKSEAIAQPVADDIHDAEARAKGGCNWNFRIARQIGTELERPDLPANFAATIICGMNIEVGLTCQQVSKNLRSQCDAA